MLHTFWHFFALFQNFSPRTFPINIKGFSSMRTKEKKKNWTSRCCTLVVALLLLGKVCLSFLTTKKSVPDTYAEGVWIYVQDTYQHCISRAVPDSGQPPSPLLRIRNHMSGKWLFSQVQAPPKRHHQSASSWVVRGCQDHEGEKLSGVWLLLGKNILVNESQITHLSGASQFRLIWFFFSDVFGLWRLHRECRKIHVITVKSCRQCLRFLVLEPQTDHAYSCAIMADHAKSCPWKCVKVPDFAWKYLILLCESGWKCLRVPDAQILDIFANTYGTPDPPSPKTPRQQKRKFQ